MSKAYKGYNLFNDIEDASLRTYNRCVMAFNISEDKGSVECGKYLEQFDDLNKKLIYTMFAYIKAKGPEAVKREIFRGDFQNMMEA